MLSIVVPTFNEKDNVIPLVDRIEKALSKIEHEIIFVDDSKDETPEVLAELASRNPNVKFEHRTKSTGLATAVLRGFELSGGDVIATLDADLQHPPELLTKMYRALKKSGADIVLPSRFIPGGSDGGLNIWRKIVSGTARYMGRICLKRLRRITDHTGGFFMFKKSVITGADLRPIGWKILMEVLVMGNYKKVIEIPYAFMPRNANESKMSMNAQVEYVKHIYNLYKRQPR